MRFRPELVELCRKEVVGSRFVVGGTPGEDSTFLESPGPA
jgi:hypothetical protein